MHSITTPNGLTFEYDGDITSPLGGIVNITSMDGDTFTVPAEDLFRFVAQIVRFARIDDLNAATDREVLGLPSSKG